MQKFLTAAVLLLLAAPSPSRALDEVQLKQGDRRITVQGKVLVEAADGGVLALGRDGQVWPVSPEQLLAHVRTGTPFTPLTPKELGEDLIAEMGPAFDLWHTKHYVICYNTNRDFARWCGGLFERLYKAFTNYWSKRGFPLHEPEFPLAVMVFAGTDSYAAYAAPELGADPQKVPGFYSFHTNRVSLFDLTAATPGRQGGRGPFRRRLERYLATDAGQMTVATIVHEATHQIAFNSGLQTRYADNPLWLTEGMAVVFETPDLKSKTGWSTIEAVNHRRLREFRNFARNRRRTDSLERLISNDDRLRRLDTGPDAYAEAWALNYFLLRTRPGQYHQYLKTLGSKPLLQFDTPEQRLADFEKAFGSLKSVDDEFIRFINDVR